MNLKNKKPEEIQEIVDGLLATGKEQAAKIVTLEKAVADKGDEIGELLNDLAGNGTEIGLLKQDIAAKDEQIETLNGIIGSAAATGNKATEPKAATAAVVVAEFDKDDKSWKANKQKFRLPGDPAEYTVAEAIADNTLWNKLMAINGQKVFTEVV